MEISSSPRIVSKAPRLSRERKGPTSSPASRALRTALLGALLINNQGCLTEFPPRGDNPDYEAPDAIVDANSVNGGTGGAAGHGGETGGTGGEGGVQTPDAAIGGQGGTGGVAGHGGETGGTGGEGGVQTPDAAIGGQGGTGGVAGHGGETGGTGGEGGQGGAGGEVPVCVPAPEVCNNLDDNCDTNVDEGRVCDIGRACTVGVGACQRSGVILEDLTCSVQPGDASAEVCDGVDNNCDGVVDNNVPVTDCNTACGAGHNVCVNGSPVCDAPTPIEENAAPLCDGIDNDCNHIIDDGQECHAGDPCEVGVGPCVNVGTLDENGVCSAQPLPGSAEACDGVDNDCNGQTDEGLDHPDSNNCGEFTVACINGEFVDQGRVDPSVEICDGVDNDCDHTIDNGCNIGSVCTEGVGVCVVQGQVALDNQGGTFCDTQGRVIAPSAEICDGVDNDCDGQTDEEFPEQGRFVFDPCRMGACNRGVVTCANGALTDVYPEPVAEVLSDAVDNNCDGSVDEGSACPLPQGLNCEAQRPGMCNDPLPGHFAAVQNCTAGVLTACECDNGRTDRTAECGCATPPCN